MFSMGNCNPYVTETQIDSASPASFMKKDLFQERKIRDRFLRIEAVDELRKKSYQGFGNAKNIIIVRIQPKGWDAKNQQQFIGKGAERNLLGNDILLNLGIKVSQKQPPPIVSDTRSIRHTVRLTVGIEVSQMKFESDSQPSQFPDTPLQRKFKLYISNRFSEILKKQAEKKFHSKNILQPTF